VGRHLPNFLTRSERSEGSADNSDAYWSWQSLHADAGVPGGGLIPSASSGQALRYSQDDNVGRALPISSQALSAVGEALSQAKGKGMTASRA
jgi:hypothetical protein